VDFCVFEVAAKPGSAQLPAAALLKARNERRDKRLRGADMLSPQGGWRLQVAGGFFPDLKISRL
jgi:hypothetical protein